MATGGAVAAGNQPPTDHGDEQDTDRRQDQSDRGEVEHGERGAGRFAAIGRDDNIRRRTDHRDHPAQQRAEGQRHQQAARRPAGAFGHLQDDGQEQRQRADIVHEAGQCPHDGRHQGDLNGGAEFRSPEETPEIADQAAALQGLADREHGGDGDDRRMAKPGEDGVDVDDAWNRDREEGQDRDDVVAPPTPNEEAQRRAQNAEYVCLFECHRDRSFPGKLVDGQFSG